MKNVECDDCKSGTRHYSDGYILKDWTVFDGDAATLPKTPDKGVFWTYIDCKKNSKGLKFVNLGDNCNGFERKV